MQNIGAHIRKFAKFLKRDDFDLFGLVYDPGITSEKTADVRPVFVYFCIDRTRNNRAADIAAAPGKSLYSAVRPCSVKSGDDGVFRFCQPSFDQRIRLFLVKRTVFVKKDDLFRVHEFPAEFCGYDARIQKFPSRRSKIRVFIFLDLFFRPVENRIDVKLQFQFADNGMKALPDLRKRLAAISGFNALFITGIQQIRHFDIVGKALSGSGNHGIFSGRIGKNDLRNLTYIVAVRQRRASEFAYLHTHFKISLPSI